MSKNVQFLDSAPAYDAKGGASTHSQHDPYRDHRRSSFHMMWMLGLHPAITSCACFASTQDWGSQQASTPARWPVLPRANPGGNLAG